MITLQVTPRTKKTIQERAKAAGLTVTDYLCYSGLGKVIVRVEGLEQVLSELKAQGGNLNQLTALANMGRLTVVKGDALAENYGKIYEQLRELLKAVNGAPTKAVNRFYGERRHSGMSELSADQAGSE
ncbi:plasmid mobilization protein [Dysosmobacter sp.]|uniref:plasmid mobilization protein n=1 Tax=Dysosmobacter sp. TaxID=2591382 RepID=UPI003A8E947E